MDLRQNFMEIEYYANGEEGSKLKKFINLDSVSSFYFKRFEGFLDLCIVLSVPGLNHEVVINGYGPFNDVAYFFGISTNYIGSL